MIHAVVDKDVRTMDKEANQFAGEFLMPEMAMVQELIPPVTLISLKPLALRWKVSVQALMARAHNLGIISLRQYKYLNQQLSSLGLRRTEIACKPSCGETARRAADRRNALWGPY